LLALLVLERTVTRERAASLLWPDLDPAAASANLRVNLTHLRRLLDPDRPAGDPTYYVRVDSSSIALHESPHLVVDAWQHDADLTARRFDDLADRWRGEPFADLAGFVDLVPSVEHLRSRHLGGLLAHGELAIARGLPAVAKECARRALSIDPFREQSHRLAIAAAMQLDSPADVAMSLRCLDEALAELGVPSTEATEVMRRRALRRYGTALDGHQVVGRSTTSR
jgi:LuxR family transcriptional regulator, maltose regulon positive regulatory protein